MNPSTLTHYRMNTVCALLKRKPVTIRRYIKNGQLRVEVFRNRNWFDKQYIDDLAASVDQSRTTHDE